MNFLGNFLWLIFGGFILAVCWFFVGILWCVSLIGIPIGIQCFKFAELALSPFGRDIVYGESAVSLFLNIIWLICGGLELAVTAVLIGLVLCVTIIGIPFGIQSFKFAKLSLMPFGARVI